MKKTGFTLAEVLVTLGIIGVVAALAMPALNSAVQKTKVGPSLRKFMYTIENSNRMAMQESDVDDLSEAIDTACTEYEKDKNGKDTSTCKAQGNLISTYLGFVNKNIAGGSIGTDTNKTYTMSSGEQFTVTKDETKTPQSNTNYKGSQFKVKYDMNGFDNKPNTSGKDQFYFIIDKNGSVLAIGSETSVKAYGDTKAVSNNANTACNAENCSGAIANNGWKVGYKY